MNIEDFELFKQNEYSLFSNNGREFLINREPYLDVVLTDFCNSNCNFCIGDLIHKKLNLDLDKAKDKIRFAVKNMKVKDCLLLGGEPTVSKILISMIEFLKTLNLNKIIITTNGIRLKKDESFRHELLSSGLTNINISVMSINEEKLNDIKVIAEEAHKHNVKVRINNNVWRNNNDSLESMLTFYDAVCPFVDSVKFSPLLKTDAFSVVETKTEWVHDNILSDEEYDELFASIENWFVSHRGISIITNNELFGFVKNSMIPLKIPILLNWNQHGKMMEKVTKEHKINNLKLLPNNELSLSWNRELTEYFINTNNVLRSYL
jgi:sulfatase maturation enzyme AslB (radical SAM superfamily)